MTIHNASDILSFLSKKKEIVIYFQTHFKECFGQALRKKRWIKNKREGLVRHKSKPVGQESDASDNENTDSNESQQPPQKKSKHDKKCKAKSLTTTKPAPATCSKPLLDEDDFRRHLDELKKVWSSTKNNPEKERQARELLFEVDMSDYGYSCTLSYDIINCAHKVIRLSFCHSNRN